MWDSPNGKRKTELKISTPKSESSVRDIPLPKFLIAKLSAIEFGSGFLINRNGNRICGKTELLLKMKMGDVFDNISLNFFV